MAQSFRKVLVFFLFFSTFVSCFFLVFSTLDESYGGKSQVYFGRRSLLDKNELDGDDLLLDIVPRKKKASSSSLIDDDVKVVSKKKKTLSLDDGDDEKVVKKKKSLGFEGGDDEKQMSKKKKSLSFDGDKDGDEKKVSKKKKSSNVVDEDGGDEDQVVKKKKIPISLSSSSFTKNQTKLTKPKISNLDSSSSKDKSTNTQILDKIKLKKLNSTSKPINSTKSPTKKSLDLLKPTSKPTPASPKAEKQKSQNPNQKQQQKPKSKFVPSSSSSWMYQDDEDEDLVLEFRDLPTKFHQSFIPDLHKISTTSKIYLNKYNKEITKGFKPYVGNKYATSLATTISFAFIILPFLLVSLIFNRIKAYFSLQKLIIFIQIYLSIYFSILCLSSLITGLEPLRFFYATSQSTYVWLQVLQTLAYVFYLLLLLMYLVLVFSTETDMGQRFLGLGQTFVGFAVGLHYYMAVFHKVVLRQPPKTNWKIHGIYATCFLVVCLFARAERRKKAYLDDEGSEEGKTS